MKTKAIQEALAFMRRAGVDGSTGFVLAEAEAELNALALNRFDERVALRDDFAKAALTGLMANPSTSGLLPRHDKALNLVARISYAIADAMLAAREAK